MNVDRTNLRMHITLVAIVTGIVLAGIFAKIALS